MNIFKKIWGKIIYSVASIISIIFDVFISIIEFIIRLVKGVGMGAISLISMGGFLFFIILGPALLFNPLTFLTIMFLIIFPIMGTKFVSYLKYVRYMTTEYLFDYADNLINDRKAKFQTFGEYGNKYRRMEEEKRRKEQQKRREAQQREWEARFRQWAEYQNAQRSSSYGSYNWSRQNTGYENQSYINPNIEFKKKYEENCNLLGIDYDSDKYQIKLAYRKNAKKYHPDLNKASDATQKFQRINDAYEFLSDANVERYKNISFK